MITRCVRDYFRAGGDTFFHRKMHSGTLRHLVLRRGEFTGEILLLLSTTSGLAAPLAPLVEALLALPLRGKIVGFLHAVNDGVADAVKHENVQVLHGRGYFYEEICNLRFKIAYDAFFQTNSAGAEVLYSVVRDFCVGQHGNLLDMYCGTGTISQVLSPYFAQVTGVELVDGAVASARENAVVNGITNCTFHAADAFEWLRGNTAQYSTIVVDPPRDGLHPKAIPLLAALRAPRIIYVACKPASLHRDSKILAAHGYSQAAVKGVDLFPRTPHVEAVALFKLLDV
jgi:23S rRNA (uracil-5-)-methyltransferase RumA